MAKVEIGTGVLCCCRTNRIVRLRDRLPKGLVHLLAEFLGEAPLKVCQHPKQRRRHHDRLERLVALEFIPVELFGLFQWSLEEAVCYRTKLLFCGRIKFVVADVVETLLHRVGIAG